MFPKRIDDLWDLTVQGIWEAHLNGELAEADVVDQVAVTADCDDLDPLARVSPWLRACTRLWSTTGRRLPVLLMVRNSAFEVYRTTLPG